MKLKVEAGFILRWDNAPVQTTSIFRDFLANKEKIETLNPLPSPYSLDLAPCDLFLSPMLKNKLAGVPQRGDL